MTDEWLVCFDTDRIKEYVFATDKLREVRGASWLLTELNNRVQLERLIRPVCPECEIVFAAGGSAVLLAPSETKAREIINVVEASYIRRTFAASITGATIPLSPATRSEGFGKRVAVAWLKVQEAKDEKARRLLPGIESYTQPCMACERHPASKVSRLDRLAICESCYAKREAFDQHRDVTAPEGLNVLGAVGRPPGYIGFIYSDGNNIGERLKQPESAEQFRMFADKLDCLIQKTVNDAFAKYPHRLGGEGQLRPYEQLLVGGDDLMLVTAGDVALSAALEITANFEQDSLEVLRAARLPDDKPLTLGTAVVLAHAAFPMAACYNLAGQLLKQAKQRCAEEGYRTGAMDFMVVTAAGSSDVKTMREEVLTQKSFVFPHGDRQIRLTQRPYTLNQARTLLERVKAFKKARFPRSQLQYLYEGLFHSQADAIYRWLKVGGRIGKGQRDTLDEFYAAFGDGDRGLPPWRRDNNPPEIDQTTALADLIEIYQFVLPEE
ncbi:MAG: hypothetical protein K8G79_13120 [bacterium]|uniref:Cas10/Cmr2 second palm domain-containing protein n=1 Tax=Candidatus Methylomirabilis tolerans TaxID=3123416 RepID=A0AAJ1AM51_9BACT|nr:hypothetical protein [Candidatus Methylomirabilis sp.]